MSIQPSKRFAINFPGSRQAIRVGDFFNKRPIALFAISSLAIILPLARRDYLTYLSYGPGGLPYNILGWLITTLVLRPLGRERLSTKLYEDPELPFATEPGWLSESSLPRRLSERPRVGHYPVPQRQLEQLPSPDTRQKLIERFSALARRAEKSKLVEIRQSVHETRHDGIFVSRSRAWHAVAQETRGEISHVHAGLDGSVHVVLCPEDCKLVIEKGWGERHGLDGVQAMKRIAGFTMPVNYILIYAPRDDAEIDTVLTIVSAAMGFMTGTRRTVEEQSTELEL